MAFGRSINVLILAVDGHILGKILCINILNIPTVAERLVWLICSILFEEGQVCGAVEQMACCRLKVTDAIALVKGCFPFGDCIFFVDVFFFCSGVHVPSSKSLTQVFSEDAIRSSNLDV